MGGTREPLEKGGRGGLKEESGVGKVDRARAKRIGKKSPEERGKGSNLGELANGYKSLCNQSSFIKRPDFIRRLNRIQTDRIQLTIFACFIRAY